jgi:hypothetical protein
MYTHQVNVKPGVTVTQEEGNRTRVRQAERKKADYQR